ncbi:MAG TPA: hypothetical protein VF698_08465 [Thermoanaerobaculia bacterium]|jgi:hypothetical protein
MPTGRLAADTLVPVTQSIVELVRKHYGGETPAFWGRYFKRPGFAEDYKPGAENAVLRANNIRLLPIARQTNRVNRSASDGAADAILNVDAFIGAFGIEYLAATGRELLMFLDVEGTSETQPPLSVDYWIGWSSALVRHSEEASGGRFGIIPAIYCRQNQNPTWQAIVDADKLGFPCFGAWVFRMRTGACEKATPEWDAKFNTPAIDLPCPIVAWQYAIDCLFEGGVDFDMLNPDIVIETSVLSRLVLPPR